MVYLIPHLIDAAARDFPAHPAVRCRGQELSYAELARRADCLANRLAAEGVGRGDRVGILMSKSLETAVAVYGIMKAGAAYVPLDPAAPLPRLLFLLRDCAIRVLVTHRDKAPVLRRLLSEDSGLECLVGPAPGDGLPGRCLGWDEVFAGPARPPARLQQTEQDLAYIIYTSGSTGDPKGIMHTHRSGLSYVHSVVELYGLRYTDRFSNHAPLHFDMSTFDFFAAAAAAAAAVIVPEEYTRLPASYSQLLADERISVFFVVPFALTQLLLHGVLPSRDLGALRWVIFGGEPFQTKHLRQLMELLPHTRFNNMYGPAETNGCTCYDVPRLDETATNVPIGRAFPNTETLVVDDADAPVGPGDSGELLVRGASMMQGYWGRPDLTQQSLYRRHVAAGFDEVFYRTGDMVHLREDGELMFRGRRDRQVKMRGYRVELDEIEAALGAIDELEECAAYLTADPEGGNRIEGAVILKKGARLTADDLLKRLRDRLPWYAVPARITLAERFPRTSSGKIDRRRLEAEAAA